MPPLGLRQRYVSATATTQTRGPGRIQSKSPENISVAYGVLFPKDVQDDGVVPESSLFLFRICYNCQQPLEQKLKKLKIVLAALISLLPLNALRLLGYRWLGYQISNAQVGFATIIAVEAAHIESAKIGPFNLFAGPMKIHIRRGASIGNRNEFLCGNWVLRPEYQNSHYARSLEICEEALITSRHYFDLSGSLILGERSWIAGIDSQFWTHGAGVQDRDIRIGPDCYIGSAVRFAPGSSIGDHVLVAMGSVVSGEISESHALVGGVPAKVLKSNFNWKDKDA